MCAFLIKNIVPKLEEARNLSITPHNQDLTLWRAGTYWSDLMEIFLLSDKFDEQLGTIFQSFLDANDIIFNTLCIICMHASLYLNKCIKTEN